MKDYFLAMGAFLLFTLFLNGNVNAQSVDFVVDNQSSCGFNVTMAVYSSCGTGSFCNTVTKIVPGMSMVTFKPICGASFIWAKMQVGSGIVDCASNPTATGPNCGPPASLHWISSTLGEIH